MFSSFYYEYAMFFFANGSPEYGVRVLSNLAELELENPQYLRLLALALDEIGSQCSLLQIDILRRVLKLRPEEPYSFLYLALALVRNANLLLTRGPNGEKPDLSGVIPATSSLEKVDELALAKKNYAEALDLFTKVLLGKWDARFAQIEVVALMELNRLAHFLSFHGLSYALLASYDHRVLAPIKVDLRVAIIWDTDMTDVGLEIIEPSGEKCNAYNNKTSSGGILSRDFTHGYGPQEYVVRTALLGTYKIFLRLFSSMQKFTGTTVLVKISTFYGHPLKENELSTSIQLYKDDEKHQVGEVVFL